MHLQVAVEIVTMVNEAMDTLVGMDLPVDGIALSRYNQAHAVFHSCGKLSICLALPPHPRACTTM
jgi:hypothetical protein